MMTLRHPLLKSFLPISLRVLRYLGSISAFIVVKSTGISSRGCHTSRIPVCKKNQSGIIESTERHFEQYTIVAWMVFSESFRMVTP